jgi:fructokinase
MRRIYAIGETVLDILFKDNLPFTARPGGACLNSSVTLGRLGLPIHFIGEYGLDEVGNYIDNFLKDNNVSTEYVYRYYDGKSALALAFLNENSDASYDFYKIYPKNRLHISFPEIKHNDIVLFGSVYAVTPEVRPRILDFIKKAKKNKAIIIYDPNFRKSHLHELHMLKPLILENLAYANIVRGSNEDFSLIFGVNNADEAFDQIKDFTSCFLYTANKKGVYLRSSQISKEYPIQKISPISTIGAGDSFNAGIVYSLLKHKIQHKDLESLSEDVWDDIAKTAIEFATHVCLRYDNYIARDFADNYNM